MDGEKGPLRDGKLNDHYKHHKGFGSLVVSRLPQGRSGIGRCSRSGPVTTPVIGGPGVCQNARRSPLNRVVVLQPLRQLQPQCVGFRARR